MSLLVASKSNKYKYYIFVWLIKIDYIRQSQGNGNYLSFYSMGTTWLSARVFRIMAKLVVPIGRLAFVPLSAEAVTSGSSMLIPPLSFGLIHRLTSLLISGREGTIRLIPDEPLPPFHCEFVPLGTGVLGCADSVRRIIFDNCLGLSLLKHIVGSIDSERVFGGVILIGATTQKYYFQ